MSQSLFVLAVAAIIVRERRVLAMRRSPHKDAGAGLWETLSGRIELGEDPKAAVQREIEEECGLEVNLEPRPLTVYQTKRNDMPMVVIVYRAHYLRGEVRLSDEHDDFAWLSSEDFAQRSPLTQLVEAVKIALAEA